MKLARCAHCDGFVVRGRCPNCSATPGRLSRMATIAATAIAGGAVSITLMACYGAPPSEYPPPQEPTPNAPPAPTETPTPTDNTDGGSVP